MLNVIAKGCFLALLALTSIGAVSGNVIYDLSLPANGNVDPISIRLTFPNYVVPDELLVFSPDDPEFTDISSGSTVIEFAATGVDVNPTTTLIGFALFTDGAAVTLNNAYPADFFVFNRLPNQNGTFFSVAGNITAESPFVLDTTTPTVQLVVSGAPIPEPASVLSFSAGALLLAALYRRRRLRS